MTNKTSFGGMTMLIFQLYWYLRRWKVRTELILWKDYLDSHVYSDSTFPKQKMDKHLCTMELLTTLKLSHYSTQHSEQHGEHCELAQCVPH